MSSIERGALDNVVQSVVDLTESFREHMVAITQSINELEAKCGEVKHYEERIANLEAQVKALEHIVIEKND